MNEIVWDAAYSVGHPEMDTQHQIIIGAINQCIGLINEEAVDAAKIAALLQQLSDYAESHFSSEEQLLEAHGFEFLGAQQNSHAIYRMKIERYMSRSIDQDQLSALIKFLNFWWMHHIQVEDMEYKLLFENGMEAL